MLELTLKQISGFSLSEDDGVHCSYLYFVVRDFLVSISAKHGTLPFLIKLGNSLYLQDVLVCFGSWLFACLECCYVGMLDPRVEVGARLSGHCR